MEQETPAPALKVPGQTETEPAEEETETERWDRYTPPPMAYFLMMEAPGGDWLQDVELTRAEFVALKAELARMRGFPPEEPETE